MGSVRPEMRDLQAVPCVVCPSGARLPEFKPQGGRRAAVAPGQLRDLPCVGVHPCETGTRVLCGAPRTALRTEQVLSGCHLALSLFGAERLKRAQMWEGWPGVFKSNGDMGQAPSRAQEGQLQGAGQGTGHGPSAVT